MHCQEDITEGQRCGHNQTTVAFVRSTCSSGAEEIKKCLQANNIIPFSLTKISSGPAFVLTKSQICPFMVIKKVFKVSNKHTSTSVHLLCECMSAYSHKDWLIDNQVIAC